MVTRTVEISDEATAHTGPAQATRLRVEHDQILIKRGDREVGRVPLEDLGFLLLDTGALSLTHAVMVRLIHHGGTMILCDDSHTPVAQLLPMSGNDLTARRLRAQAAMKLPLRKRLWRQIVRHKVTGQALNLPEDHQDRKRLIAMAREVRSGDKGNIEGQAARFYWPALLGERFRRDPDGEPPNNLLNYGYMVMRAACARAIVAAGLHPVFALNHSHRANTFALADDLLELFRPRVDRAVKSLVRRGISAIGRDSKKVLLSLLGEPIVVGGNAGPMMVQLARVVTSLVDCIEGRRDDLELPAQAIQGVQVLPGRFTESRPDEDFTRNGEGGVRQ